MTDTDKPSPLPADAPAGLLASMPFAAELGIDLQEATANRVLGSLPWSPGKCTVGGVLHGGALMTLADSVGAVCAFLNLPAGAGTSTVESKTNFLRPVLAGRVHAEARPLHTGRTVVVVQTDLRDDENRLCGRTTQTQLVIPPKNGTPE